MTTGVCRKISGLRAQNLRNCLTVCSPLPSSTTARVCSGLCWDLAPLDASKVEIWSLMSRFGRGESMEIETFLTSVAFYCRFPRCWLSNWESDHQTRWPAQSITWWWPVSIGSPLLSTWCNLVEWRVEGRPEPAWPVDSPIYTYINTWMHLAEQCQGKKKMEQETKRACM